jgi:hypothetical protein
MVDREGKPVRECCWREWDLCSACAEGAERAEVLSNGALLGGWIRAVAVVE